MQYKRDVSLMICVQRTYSCRIPDKSKFQSGETLCQCLRWVRDKSQSQSLHSKIVPRISSNLSIHKNDTNLRVPRRTTSRSIVDNPRLDASREFLRLQTFRSRVLEIRSRGVQTTSFEHGIHHLVVDLKCVISDLVEEPFVSANPKVAHLL